jgi:hypothetical protein
MPHQNRVTPFGDIIATTERGTLYGNRGCLVDKHGKIARRFKEIRWIICVLDFKNRRHPMMAPGLYTGLFFLDEATAFAAGHRPCAECQRERFELFRSHWSKANPNEAGSGKPLAPVIDAVLHQERLRKRSLLDSTDELPDGTLVTDNETDAYLLITGELFRWTPGGYLKDKRRQFDSPFRVLTPGSMVKTLAGGYPVSIHDSAFGR